MGAGRAIRTVLFGGAMVLASLACGGAPEETESAATAQVPQGTGAPAAPDAGTAGRLSPMPTHDSTLAGHPEAGPSGELAWTVPNEWIVEAPKSEMRRAQYRLPAGSGGGEDGECVVYYFGAGQGGEVKPNLDRWAAQFGGQGSTPPKFSEMKAGGFSISRAEAKGTYTGSPMSMGGGPEPEPKPGYMLLGAIVPGPESNWFFKCTGPQKTMEANRARFDALLASIHGGH